MRSVLIVEDDGELAELMRRTFESEGIAARIASSAENAYGILTTSVFNCLIVDVNLPGDDGYALCRNLRERSGVPVVFAKKAQSMNPTPASELWRKGATRTSRNLSVCASCSPKRRRS